MKKVLIALFVAGVFCGCLKGEPDRFTCSFNECGTVAPIPEIDSVKAYLATHSLIATQHCSGAFFSIDEPGTGAAPSACSNIAFTYEGRLKNGQIFDSSLTNPAVGPLSGLITGFKLGLLNLKAGGRMHMYIPPSLGYGSSTTGNIPPNSMLIFDVRLVAVQ